MPKLPKNSPHSSDDAKSEMEEILEGAGPSGESPYSVRVFKSSNGDVDGELLLQGFYRGQALDEVVINLLNNIKQNIPGMWIATGVRYTAPEGVKSADFRFKGMHEAFSYYWNATPNGVISTFLTLQNLLKNLKRKRREKPEQLLIRLHWNKENDHPGRMPVRHRRTFPKRRK